MFSNYPNIEITPVRYVTIPDRFRSYDYMGLRIGRDHGIYVPSHGWFSFETNPPLPLTCGPRS